MRARDSNVLRASRGAQHHDESRPSGDDPFADVRDDRSNEPAAQSAGFARAQRDASHGGGGEQPQPLNGTAQHAVNGSSVDAEGMRYPESPLSPRIPAMRSSPSTRAEATEAPGATDAHEPLGPDDPLAPLPFNPYKGNRGVTRAWHALKNSLAGFRVAIREESAFRQELTLAAILVPCGLVVPVEPVARVLLLGSVLLVLIVELLNSSVEAAIDRISLERHELSRRAKDLGSAAVMVALFMCVMTWALIVGPLVVRWIGSMH